MRRSAVDGFLGIDCSGDVGYQNYPDNAWLVRRDGPVVFRGPGGWGRVARVAPEFSFEVVPERLRPALAALIRRLVEGDFDGLVRDGFAPGHGGGDLGLWVRDYPADLVDLPEEGWQLSEAVPVPGQAGVWFVVVPLWTRQEGRSDLSMEATVVERGDEVDVQVDNIHVL